MNEAQAVVLAILLSKNGVQLKPPDVISKTIHAVRKAGEPAQLLDSEGRQVYDRWVKIWDVGQ